jgi:hypothetical protein
MQGFGYFMMSLAVAATAGFTASAVALTLPWARPIKAKGRVVRILVSILLVFCAFVVLAGQGHAPIFVLALSAWLAIAAYFTFIRHGILDPPQVETSAQESFESSV